MICLASESSADLLLSSAPVTLSSPLRALVWSVGTKRSEPLLPWEGARDAAEFWDRGGATRSLLALLSASWSFPDAMYISTESCMYHRSHSGLLHLKRLASLSLIYAIEVISHAIILMEDVLDILLTRSSGSFCADA